MGDFASDTLRDTIEAGWAPSNTRIPKATSSGIEQIVHFLAHPQIEGAHEWPLAVEIQGILDPQVPDNENQVVHPHFTINNHNFSVSCVYRLRNINEALWDQAEQDIEDMCVETLRILKTVYNPQAGTGAFFNVRYDWKNDDDLTKRKQILRRTLIFSLSEVQSDSTEVFRGNTQILVLDTSASTADSKPAGDYTYTEVTTTDSNQGYDTIPELISGGTAGQGIPVYFSGEFSGEFTGEMFIKKSDINASTIDSLDNIYKLQTSGEHAIIFLLNSVDNTEGTPVTFTESIPLIVTNIRKNITDEDLARYTLTARITEPTAYTVA